MRCIFTPLGSKYNGITYALNYGLIYKHDTKGMKMKAWECISGDLDCYIINGDFRNVGVCRAIGVGEG